MKNPNSFLATNLKFLRSRIRKEQKTIADAIDISLSMLKSYENGIAKTPPVEILIKLSEFYKMSIDSLLKVDLSKLNELEIRKLEAGDDLYLTGGKIRILATTVDKSNKENIELVNEKAKAGYLTGYSDPEYISKLPTFQLPDLSKERKYRMFQISGDSMLPVLDKSYVLGEYVEDWTTLKDLTAHIIISRDNGIAFKVLLNRIKKDKTLLLRSLNPVYADFEIPVEDVLEVWKFIRLYTSQLPQTNSSMQHLTEAMNDIRNEMKKLNKTPE